LKTAIFLSVREKATRLPKKVLRDVCGQSMTAHLVDRLLLAKEPDLVVLTTSVHPDDEVLCRIAAEKGILSFRGSEEDKLVRYRDAARAFDVEFFVVVDGDDIFCSEEHIDEIIRAWRRTGADHIYAEGLPLGAAGFGLKATANEKVCELKQESDTEVWGGYFKQPGMFHVLPLPVEDEALRHPEYRMTLDYEEDLMFFQATMEALYRPGHVPPFREIMAFLNARPDVVALNAAADQRYREHLRKAAPVRMQTVAVEGA